MKASPTRGLCGVDVRLRENFVDEEHFLRFAVEVPDHLVADWRAARDLLAEVEARFEPYLPPRKKMACTCHGGRP